MDIRDQDRTIDQIPHGDMVARIRAFGWAATPLGPRDAWSPSLKLAVEMITATNFPMALRWGPELVLIYNDAYAPLLREHHPGGLGKSFAQFSWGTQVDLEGSQRLVLNGEALGLYSEDLPMLVRRAGDTVEQGYFNLTLSPIPDDTTASGVGGVLLILIETTQRVRTEHALRASEERYHLALEAASGVGTWDWDVIADKLYGDDRYAAFHNLSPERAAQGVPIAETMAAVHPDDLARTLSAGRRSLKITNSFLEDYRLVQADGSVKWVQVRGRVYRDDNGQPVRHRGVMVDITERKRIEAALEATEANLRIAVDAAGLGRWDHSPLTGQRFWDKRCRQIFGVPDEMENTVEVFERQVHPDDLPSVREAVRAAMDPAGDGGINCEYRIQRNGGNTPRWVEAFGRAFFEDGQCVRFVGVVRDVTERKEAAARMVLQEATLALAVDAGNVGTWDYNPNNGALVCSERLYAMFGIQPGDPVILKDFFAVMHDEDREATWTSLMRAMDPVNGGDYDVEYRTIGRDDGIERWIAAKGRAFFDESGQPLRVVGATVDITERKRAELHLRLMVNELNHRVKNTLATIQAIAAQTFHATRPLPQAQAREAFTARIMALAEAHDILTRENWEGAEMEDVLDRLRNLHGGPGCFVFSGPPVWLSPRMALSLSMALHELATNATKYGALSVPDGQVRIEWTVTPGLAAARLTLTWTEFGGPPVTVPTRRGFGSRLIERGLTADLSGEARIDFAPEGVICRIEAGLQGSPCIKTKA
jgi:PAS domain S-box-containing protein